MISAYDRLGPLYDAWCRSVTEDIDFYVGLAVESGGPVLEIGVGSGRVAVPIALAGVRVVGIDSSERMLGLAREKARPHRVELELVHGDMRDLPPLGRFPLVVVPFRAFLHLREDAERLAVLRALRERLVPGGLLAFDVFHPDRVDIEETHGRLLEREPGIYERAVWDPLRRRLELTVVAHGTEAGMELFWAAPERWAALLGEAGFAEVACYGWFDRRPLEPGAADSVWIARRPVERP